VNLCFFLEGRRTEPKVYRAWVNHVFPQLTEVKIISDVRQDNYLLISGFGHPQMLTLLEGILDDISQHGGIDHFFVCLDAEEDPPEARRQQIEASVFGKLSHTTYHVVIHNCCIETWFLGNRQVMKRNPQSQRLRVWKAFYDVSKQCPESMECHPDFRLRADFHLEYLKEMLRERGLNYSKSLPRPVQESSYLLALVERHEKTGHIQSFGQLVKEWRAIGGTI
jgi:hypothetical protein